VSELANRVLSGDLRATARLCRLADDRVPGYRDAMKALYPHTRGAWMVGITGNPGAGKSTLVDRLLRLLRAEGVRVGVVAVDPTSPFSGGAILGDRIRMQEHFSDPDVFIRSVATRGALGGLSRSALDIARVLAGWGAKVVLIETVGVGQDELEIANTADSTLVVVAPGLGDDVQALKAGILECADVFAVNKADLAGADAAAADLEHMLSLGADTTVVHGHRVSSVASNSIGERWIPPVLKCVASRGDGVAEILTALRAHRAWLESERGSARRFARAKLALTERLKDALAERVVGENETAIDVLAAKVLSGAVDPYSAVDELLGTNA
jgi:LAO/AO transport system kinase